MVPSQKIVKFTMGKGREFNDGKFPYILTVVSDEKGRVQIRHNALEACRQVLNKQLNEELNGQFFLHVVPFPHHIQRENRMLTGAGADRMQTGMQLAFGKAISKSAFLKNGSRVFVIAVPTEKGVAFARKIIRQIKSKLPMKIRVEFEDLKKAKKQAEETKNSPKKSVPTEQ